MSVTMCYLEFHVNVLYVEKCYFRFRTLSYSHSHHKPCCSNRKLFVKRSVPYHTKLTLSFQYHNSTSIITHLQFITYTFERCKDLGEPSRALMGWILVNLVLSCHWTRPQSCAIVLHDDLSMVCWPWLGEITLYQCMTSLLHMAQAPLILWHP